MSLYNKFLNLFKKSSNISVTKENSELYETVKENMDNFEKNTTIDNIRILTKVTKQLVVEIQVLKEAIINQNQTLHNLVVVNQRIVEMLNAAMDMDMSENIDYNEDDEDITETAEEKSQRETSKKFGAN